MRGRLGIGVEAAETATTTPEEITVAVSQRGAARGCRRRRNFHGRYGKKGVEEKEKELYLFYRKIRKCSLIGECRTAVKEAMNLDAKMGGKGR